MLLQLSMLGARKSSNMKLSHEIFFRKNNQLMQLLFLTVGYTIEAIESFHKHFTFRLEINLLRND